MWIFSLVIVVYLGHVATSVQGGNLLMRATSTASKEVIMMRSTTALLLRVMVTRETMASVTSMILVHLWGTREASGVGHLRAIAVRLVRRGSVGVGAHVIVERHLRWAPLRFLVGTTVYSRRRIALLEERLLLAINWTSCEISAVYWATIFSLSQTLLFILLALGPVLCCCVCQLAEFFSLFFLRLWENNLSVFWCNLNL